MTSQSPTLITKRTIIRHLNNPLADPISVVSGIKDLLTLSPDSPRSVSWWFDRALERHSERPFLRTFERTWTYSEADTEINAIAHQLQRRGVGYGSVVSVLLSSRAESLLCTLAIARLGAIAGLINNQQQANTLEHSITTIKPFLSIVGAECHGAFVSIPRHIWGEHVFGVDDPQHGQLPGEESLTQASLRSPDYRLERTPLKACDPAYFVFTSGTTGMPKAARMTGLRWSKVGAGFGGATMRLNSNDTLMCVLPLYHNNAMTVALSSVIRSGACFALVPRFSASNFWAQAIELEATAFIYIGELCRYLLNQDPGPLDREHSVRLITGNGLRPQMWEEFCSRFGIGQVAEFYAASEVNAAFVNAFNIAKTAGFCPLPYRVIKYDPLVTGPARDTDGYFIRVKTGEVGLLVTQVTERSPFDGYTNASANEKKLLHDGEKRGDCWINTGDLVLDQGCRHVSFVDRVGDTFRWKGENVATTEVEAALCAQSQVDEAVVFGVQVPGADGRAGMAAVQLHKGSTFDGEIFSQWVNQQLPEYARPLFIRIVSEVEHTSTFKNRKQSLREQGYLPALLNAESSAQDPIYVLTKTRGYVPFYDDAAVDIAARGFAQ